MHVAINEHQESNQTKSNLRSKPPPRHACWLNRHLPHCYNSLPLRLTEECQKDARLLRGCPVMLMQRCERNSSKHSNNGSEEQSVVTVFELRGIICSIAQSACESWTNSASLALTLAGIICLDLHRSFVINGGRGGIRTLKGLLPTDSRLVEGYRPIRTAHLSHIQYLHISFSWSQAGARC